VLEIFLPAGQRESALIGVEDAGDACGETAHATKQQEGKARGNAQEESTREKLRRATSSHEQRCG